MSRDISGQANLPARSLSIQAPWDYRLRRTLTILLIYGAILAALLFFLFPYFWMVASAFKSPGDVTTYPPVWLFSPTMENFDELIEDMGALSALQKQL